MRYIGRIISKRKISGVPEYIEVTQETDSVVGCECKIPTLIIGHKYAEDVCSKNLKYTEKNIGNNLYWTFSKSERRSDYETDLEKFFKFVIENLNKLIEYEYIDLISSKDMDSNFFGVIEGRQQKIVYETDTMYYVFCPLHKKVYGLSKDVLGFMEKESGFIERFKHAAFINDEVVSGIDCGKKKYMNPVLYYLTVFCV